MYELHDVSICQFSTADWFSIAAEMCAKTPILRFPSYSQISPRALDFPHPTLVGLLSLLIDCFLQLPSICAQREAASYRALQLSYTRQVALWDTSQPGNSNSTSGIQLVSQVILHSTTAKPQGCSKHPLSANCLPLPELRKQEHAWPSPRGAPSSSLTPLCLAVSTSVSQYSSHWLNCTCLLIYQTNRKEPLV